MLLCGCVLLALLGQVQTGSVPPNVEMLPGVIKVEKGSLYEIDSYIHVRYSLGPVVSLTANIDLGLQQIEKLQTQILQDPILTQTHKHLLANTTQDAISSARAKLPHTKQTRRYARGLFNFVGSIQHALFGVIDENTLHDKLIEFKDRIDTISHTYDASATAINAIEHNVRLLKQAIQHLELRVNGSHNISEVDHFAQLSLLVSNVRFKLQTLVWENVHLSQAIAAATKGIVEPTLISPADINTILQSIRLEDNVTPLFEPKVSPLFYATLSSYITPQGLSLVIPLAPRSTFKVYELNPFPEVINGVVELAYIEAHHTILANASMSIITPHRPLLDICKKPTEDIYICMKPIWHVNTNEPSCERAILFDPHLIPELCTFNIFTPTTSPFYIPLGEVTAIYFSTPTRVTVTCEHRLPSETINGTYILPHTCSLRSKHLKLEAARSFKSSYEKMQPSFEPFMWKRQTLADVGDKLNLTLETMDTLNLLPRARHETTIAFVYPLGISLSLFAIGSAVAVVMSKKLSGKARDHISTVELEGNEKYDEFVRTMEACRKLTIERLSGKVTPTDGASEGPGTTTKEAS